MLWYMINLVFRVNQYIIYTHEYLFGTKDTKNISYCAKNYFWKAMWDIVMIRITKKKKKKKTNMTKHKHGQDAWYCLV